MSNNWISPLGNKIVDALDGKIIDLKQGLIWKEHDCQVVVKGADKFYKIYQRSDDNSYQFPCQVRDIIGEVYRDVCDIEWDVQTVSTSKGNYQISERQAVEVCDPAKISFSELYTNYKKLHKLVEDKLQLNWITKQLKLEIPNLKEVKLLRDTYNCHEDYGICPNGQVILLDDSDWVLVFIDNNDQWMYSPFAFHEVKIDGKIYTICPLIWDRIANGELDIKRCLRAIDKWTIVEGSMNYVNLHAIQNRLQSDQRQELTDNLSILLT